MFLCNLRHSWSVSNGVPAGAVIHVAAFDSGRPTHDLREIPFVIFDPGVYLWDLPSDDCGTTCVYLATYPWVPIDLPSYDEVEETKRKDWRQNISPAVHAAWPPKTPTGESELFEIVERCADWQVDHGASMIVLPAPLIRGLSTMDEYLRWLDTGLAVSTAHEQPSIMAVPLASSACSSVLEQLLDALSARDQLGGVYLTIESSTTSRYLTDRDAVRALLEISYHLGHRGRKHVVVNFADLFGVACVGVGATSFSTGYFGKDRQLNLSDFIEGDGSRGAYPRWLSVKSCCRFRTGRDMAALRNGRLLSQLSVDTTSASQPLLDALAAGRDAADVPGWAETPNNVGLARAHLVELLSRVSADLEACDTTESRTRWVFNWLQQAEMLCGYYQRRFADDPLDEMGVWTGLWRSEFEAFAQSYQLL